MEDPLRSPLEDPDLLMLIFMSSGIEFDYDVQHPSTDRAALRLLHSTATKLLDGLCTSYRDTRRACEPFRIDAGEVADGAATALRRLGPLRKLQLEGLDDDALATVLAQAGRTTQRGGSRALETLWLQRGVFTGSCLYTCHPKLDDDVVPGRSPIVGDDAPSCGSPPLSPSQRLPSWSRSGSTPS